MRHLLGDPKESQRVPIRMHFLCVYGAPVSCCTVAQLLFIYHLGRRWRTPYSIMVVPACGDTPFRPTMEWAESVGPEWYRAGMSSTPTYIYYDLYFVLLTPWHH